ncbi:YqjF family protein [Mucilaginibacter ginsenosidivorans]|uniref:DUF2071 domain-containing protein n=1 Tax=Mucilaginibacter ginsenosidivorans TaxID=398053 RepID=A0A5B8V2S4_9SPHI|nr:DUF2071 domain-containing protein [Mucilaginibacter ginsenosidivorans]QEC64991.1 DUF2071 domain-containing protein [Mucilaginibacter ginsenosidivorans]
MQKKEFLKARWINLLMLNYEVDPAVLAQYIPPATELDLWQGKALVSMVGFLFKETAVKGIKWPLHINFDEVNLRFYVKHFNGKEWKRGAVFISEIVPKPFIALFANMLYKEHYRAMPMRHSVDELSGGLTKYLYEWKFDGRWNNRLGGTVVNADIHPIVPGSQEEFIFEHYWGYNKISKTKTREYQVEHITWNAANVIDPVFEADVAQLYGKEFVPYLTTKPYSAFFADGSEVIVRGVEKIRADRAPLK